MLTANSQITAADKRRYSPCAQAPRVDRRLSSRSKGFVSAGAEIRPDDRGRRTIAMSPTSAFDVLGGACSAHPNRIGVEQAAAKPGQTTIESSGRALSRPPDFIYHRESRPALG